jgi:hypothetical protein
MRSRLNFVHAGALLIGLVMAGCAVAPADRYYDGGASYGSVYRGGIFSGTTFDRYDEVYRVAPRHHHGARTSAHRSYSDRQGARTRIRQNETPRAVGNLKNWRDGDGSFRRKQRERRGFGLEERQRRNRQERLLESRQDRADLSRVRRGSGQVELQGSSSPSISEQFDQDVGRRLERSTQEQRRAQRRALEVRRQLLAERRAESK